MVANDSKLKIDTAVEQTLLIRFTGFDSFVLAIQLDFFSPPIVIIFDAMAPTAKVT